VIRINIQIQDRIARFFTIARYGKVDILYDMATDYRKKREFQLNLLDRCKTDKLRLDIIHPGKTLHKQGPRAVIGLAINGTSVAVFRGGGTTFPCQSRFYALAEKQSRIF